MRFSDELSLFHCLNINPFNIVYKYLKDYYILNLPLPNIIQEQISSSNRVYTLLALKRYDEI